MSVGGLLTKMWENFRKDTRFNPFFLIPYKLKSKDTPKLILNPNFHSIDTFWIIEEFTVSYFQMRQFYTSEKWNVLYIALNLYLWGLSGRIITTKAKDFYIGHKALTSQLPTFDCTTLSVFGKYYFFTFNVLHLTEIDTSFNVVSYNSRFHVWSSRSWFLCFDLK